MKVFHVLTVNENGRDPHIRTFNNRIDAEKCWEEIVPEWKDDGIEHGNFWTDEGLLVVILEGKVEFEFFF